MHVSLANSHAVLACDIHNCKCLRSSFTQPREYCVETRMQDKFQLRSENSTLSSSGLFSLYDHGREVVVLFGATGEFDHGLIEG